MLGVVPQLCSVLGVGSKYTQIHCNIDTYLDMETYLQSLGRTPHAVSLQHLAFHFNKGFKMLVCWKSDGYRKIYQIFEALSLYTILFNYSTFYLGFVGITFFMILIELYINYTASLF